MWPFKNKRVEVPVLEFTERQTSPYSEDNVTIIHVGSVVHGTIVKTNYGTYKVEFCRDNNEYMNIGDAIDGVKKRWDHLNNVSRIGIK